MRPLHKHSRRWTRDAIWRFVCWEGDVVAGYIERRAEAERWIRHEHAPSFVSAEDMAKSLDEHIAEHS